MRELLLTLMIVGCNKKATPAQCDRLIERYAELVVREQLPDASAHEIELERDREQSAARADVAFKDCPKVVEASSYDCAMRAATPDALERCLE